MDLYYNLSRQCRVDADNNQISSKPTIYLAEKPTWTLHFYSGDPGSGTTAVDLSDVVTWRAAIDNDWTGTTVPMCRTISGIDQTKAADGILGVPLNANTQRCSSAVEGKKSLDATFELRGYDSNGVVIRIIQMDVMVHNTVDPSEGQEVPVDLSLVTAEAADVLAPKRIYTSGGSLVTGSIQTVTPTVSGGIMIVPKGYVANATEIPAGADVSPTTASAADVRAGKVFVNAAGVQTSGTMADISSATITPTTSSIVISGGKYLDGNLVVEGDENLTAENIASGTSIFGVSGTHAGGMTFYKCESVMDNIAFDVAVSGGGSSTPFDGRYMPDGLTSSGWQRWKQTSGGSSMVDPFYIFLRSGYAQFGSSPEGDIFGTVKTNGRIGWNSYELNGVDVYTTPVNLSSSVWTGKELVSSGGYFVVNSSGSASSLTYTGIKPEVGTCYSMNAAIVLQDYWRADYGLCVDALASGWLDDLGSYCTYEGFNWEDPSPDENGWFWFGSGDYIEYLSPGSQEWWEGSGGDGDPWNAKKNSMTVQFDFMWDSSVENNYPCVFGCDGFAIKHDNSGNVGIDCDLASFPQFSYQISASTNYNFIVIFDRDYFYLIINNTLVAQGKSYDQSGEITSANFGGYENECRFGIKNAKIWSRAMRNMIPAGA